MQKHTTRAIRLGGLSIGGGAPVMVQSMTNTDTRDAAAETKSESIHALGVDAGGTSHHAILHHGAHLAAPA